MKSKNFCLSVSRKNEDVLDMIEEYTDMFGLLKANTVLTILREYPKLKQAERVRELQAIRYTGGILNAI